MRGVARPLHLLLIVAMLTGLSGLCPVPTRGAEAADSCSEAPGDEADHCPGDSDGCPDQDQNGCSPVCSCICGRTVGAPVAALVSPAAPLASPLLADEPAAFAPAEPALRGVFHPPRAS